MYLWRFSIAITLGLVWYFSDCVRSVTQYILCIFFCFSSSLFFENSGREYSTQTDEETLEHPLQVLNHISFGNNFYCGKWLLLRAGLHDRN